MGRGSLWNQCVEQLERELPEKQLNTWIRPLQAVEGDSALRLLAPNPFVTDWVRSNFLERITALARTLAQNPELSIVLEIGSSPDTIPKVTPRTTRPVRDGNVSTTKRAGNYFESHLTQSFTFDNFVEGKCNQLARAAAFQVSEHPGRAYNPLLIYGGVGLGKTHLMQAVGNRILAEDRDKRVVYLRSERFVADMVKALQHNTINDFKRFYRSVDVLLIDDIQFFAGKERSQEEFFHTFNELLESKQQIILTCDRYPKDVDGLEVRLQSRFGWGLTQAIEPPELETRVAIMQRKAEDAKVDLDSDTAFFIAKRIRSNIRELEGALNRVIANANFIGSRITMDFARDALRDLLAVHDRAVTIENIQKTVAEFYKIRVADLHSKRRSRSITRPRQLCMALAKELTSHSLPEIGDAFGGRDHTTVLHACRKVRELREADSRLDEDYNTLLRILAS